MIKYWQDLAMYLLRSLHPFDLDRFCRTETLQCTEIKLCTDTRCSQWNFQNFVKVRHPGNRTQPVLLLTDLQRGFYKIKLSSYKHSEDCTYIIGGEIPNISAMDGNESCLVL